MNGMVDADRCSVSTSHSIARLNLEGREGIGQVVLQTTTDRLFCPFRVIGSFTISISRITADLSRGVSQGAKVMRSPIFTLGIRPAFISIATKRAIIMA